MRILINGAGIAGPTLAYWLRKSDHDVLLVEQMPRLRTGGYVIDFWGIGYDVAEKMGLLSRISELGYHVTEVRFVDRKGRKCGGFSTDAFSRLTHGRFTSLRRADLAAAICDALDEGVETIFGDTVASLEEKGHCMLVGFDHAPAREVDLVIGADGLHSRVRRLVFGRDDQVEVSLGYHVAAFEIQEYSPRNELVYVSHGVPGRQVSRFSMRDDRTLFLFVFRDECMTGCEPSTERERKNAVSTTFADVGWECPQILAALEKASDLYFDRVSQIRLDRWAKGRAALVGDAAACVSLMAGEGSGLAMAEAYVLAGELRTCGGDHGLAFDRYQERMMPFLKHKQLSAAKFASSFAPRTALGLKFRDLVTHVLRIPFVADFLFASQLGDQFELPDYGF